MDRLHLIGQAIQESVSRLTDRGKMALSVLNGVKNKHKQNHTFTTMIQN